MIFGIVLFITGITIILVLQYLYNQLLLKGIQYNFTDVSGFDAFILARDLEFIYNFAVFSSVAGFIICSVDFIFGIDETYKKIKGLLK